jgi:hypothetical protein
VQLLNDIDDKIINDFKNNARTWCELQEILDIEYRPLVDDDDNYDEQVMRLQLDDIVSSEPYLKLFDENCNMIHDANYETYLKKNTTIQTIIELRGLIIDINESENVIYPFLRTHQIKYCEDKEMNFTLENYSFVESENHKMKTYNIESSENDDSSEDEESPEYEHTTTDSEF